MPDESTFVETSIKVYLRVFVALLVLLFITVGIAFIPTGGHRAARDMLTIVGFTIAAIKATLIILWFMHVKGGTRMTRVFASTGFIWLLIMFGLTMNDYFTREAIPGSGKEPPTISESSGMAQEYTPEGSTGMRENR